MISALTIDPSTLLYIAGFIVLAGVAWSTIPKKTPTDIKPAPGPSLPEEGGKPDEEGDDKSERAELVAVCWRCVDVLEEWAKEEENTVLLGHLQLVRKDFFMGKTPTLKTKKTPS